MKRLTSGGGWRAILYTLKKARETGGFFKLWKAMRSKNACKTCALGMGGQNGGMVNEAGSFPEVCKKSLQAMAADMQGAIKPEFWSTYSIPQLQAFSPRELESCGEREIMIVSRRDARELGDLEEELLDERAADRRRVEAEHDVVRVDVLRLAAREHARVSVRT